jgi:hypothetical protein
MSVAASIELTVDGFYAVRIDLTLAYGLYGIAQLAIVSEWLYTVSNAAVLRHAPR